MKSKFIKRIGLTTVFEGCSVLATLAATTFVARKFEAHEFGLIAVALLCATYLDGLCRLRHERVFLVLYRSGKITDGVFFASVGLLLALSALLALILFSVFLAVAAPHIDAMSVVRNDAVYIFLIFFSRSILTAIRSVLQGCSMEVIAAAVLLLNSGLLLLGVSLCESRTQALIVFAVAPLAAALLAAIFCHSNIARPLHFEVPMSSSLLLQNYLASTVSFFQRNLIGFAYVAIGDTGEVATYFIAKQITDAIVKVLTNGVSPLALNYFVMQKKDKIAKRLAQSFLAFGLILSFIAIVVVFAGGLGVSLVYGPGFEEVTLILLWLLFGAAFELVSNVVGVAFHSKLRFWLSIWPSVIGSAFFISVLALTGSEYVLAGHVFSLFLSLIAACIIFVGSTKLDP